MIAREPATTAGTVFSPDATRTQNDPPVAGDATARIELGNAGDKTATDCPKSPNAPKKSKYENSFKRKEDRSKQEQPKVT